MATVHGWFGVVVRNQGLGWAEPEWLGMLGVAASTVCALVARHFMRVWEEHMPPITSSGSDLHGSYTGLFRIHPWLPRMAVWLWPSLGWTIAASRSPNPAWLYALVGLVLLPLISFEQSAKLFWMLLRFRGPQGPMSLPTWCVVLGVEFYF